MLQLKYKIFKLAEAKINIQYKNLLKVLFARVHQAVVLENSCMGEGFPAFLALIWPSIGVNAFMANLFAAIIEMPITVQTLIGSLTRVSSYMCAKFAHLTK